MSTYERNMEMHIIRALQEVLAGREPQKNDVAVLTGDVRACIDALVDALHADGVQAVRQAFTALVKDRPWLGKLASQPTTDTTQEGPIRRIRFLPDSEFENRPPREWLIPQILPKAGIAMVFGPPGCGKSFLTMAWSLCIASGTSWLGRSVGRGPVAYIAGEGSFGLGPRIKAWKHHHRFSGNSGVQWFDEAVVLQDPRHFNEMLVALREDFTEPPVLIVIDTLSRCSGGADENSNTEMAKVIASADILQQEFGCTVLIVHHAGKDRDRGPRGASSLIGNTETIIEVSATSEGCKVTCFKQKDAPKFDHISLKLQQVQYGSEEGDNSAVLIIGNKDAQEVMSKSESIMYMALQGKELSYSEWIQVAMEGDAKVISKSGAEFAITKLLKAGLVQKEGKIYRHTASAESEDDTSVDD